MTSCKDDGSPGTLRAAAAGAVSGDVLDLTALACSLITLVSGQIEIDVDDLTIEGPGSDELTIDGGQGANYQPINNGRVFQHNGVGNLTIEHLAVDGGLVYDSSGFGGCINSSNGAVTLNDTAVMSCRTIATGHLGVADGGGVYAKGALSISDSVVLFNEAVAKLRPDHGSYGVYAAGGGVASRGAITVTNTQITLNRVRAYLPLSEGALFQQAAGGGIAAYGTLTVSGSVISENFAGCDTSVVQCDKAVGGGIRSSGGMVIDLSTVTRNVAEGTRIAFSGGIESEGYDVQIRRSTISGNEGRALLPGRNWGGGVLVSGGTTFEVSDSTISENSAGSGGGVWLDGTEAVVSNTTISGNFATDYAGGIMLGYFGASSLMLSNSTVTLNFTTGDAGGGGIVDANHRAGTSALQSSIVAGNSVAPGAHEYDADLGVAFGAVDGANNLIIAANGVTLPPDTLSVDPMLGPLRANGGPTMTHALLAASPAIDAGNNTAKLTFDQRGADFLRVFGVAADIGAFETQLIEDRIFADGFDGTPP